MTQFIDKQSGSEDACHARLLEARHQLNNVHALVSDLVQQVNATEVTIIIYDKEMQGKLNELEALNEWKEDHLSKCLAKQAQDKQMFMKLTGEMNEMKQIASPEVVMDIKTRSVQK